MNLSNLIIYFVSGGLFTTLIVALEESNNRLLSGLATLIPVFTLVAYLFIGQTKGGAAVGQHAWFVLVGTLLSWVPYMLIVAYYSPSLGAHKAILIGLATFFVLALLYLAVVSRLNLFQ
ncbi:MAG: hypothetical protein Q8L21_00505 [Candidatus Komeilibacteria bacterium]|nr:hypothetical protein [Candidatus Komeilibacteria bacterium]